MKTIKATPEVEHIAAEQEHISKEETQSDIRKREEESRERNNIFPDAYIEPLRGLMFLGALEREVEYGNHTFLIRTLREGELIRIGQLMKDLRGTLTEVEARKAYVVAGSIVKVDGMDLCMGIKDGYDEIYEKFMEVKKWYPSVIKFLYEKYIELEITAMEVADSLKKS